MGRKLFEPVEQEQWTLENIANYAESLSQRMTDAQDPSTVDSALRDVLSLWDLTDENSPAFSSYAHSVGGYDRILEGDSQRRISEAINKSLGVYFAKIEYAGEGGEDGAIDERRLAGMVDELKHLPAQAARLVQYGAEHDAIEPELVDNLRGVIMTRAANEIATYFSVDKASQAGDAVRRYVNLDMINEKTIGTLRSSITDVITRNVRREMQRINMLDPDGYKRTLRNLRHYLTNDIVYGPNIASGLRIVDQAVKRKVGSEIHARGVSKLYSIMTQEDANADTLAVAVSFVREFTDQMGSILTEAQERELFDDLLKTTQSAIFRRIEGGDYPAAQEMLDAVETRMYISDEQEQSIRRGLRRRTASFVLSRIKEGDLKQAAEVFSNMQEVLFDDDTKELISSRVASQLNDDVADLLRAGKVTQARQVVLNYMVAGWTNIQEYSRQDVSNQQVRTAVVQMIDKMLGDGDMNELMRIPQKMRGVIESGVLEEDAEKIDEETVKTISDVFGRYIGEAIINGGESRMQELDRVAKSLAELNYLDMDGLSLRIRFNLISELKRMFAESHNELRDAVVNLQRTVPSSELEKMIIFRRNLTEFVADQLLKGLPTADQFDGFAPGDEPTHGTARLDEVNRILHESGLIQLCGQEKVKEKVATMLFNEVKEQSVESGRDLRRLATVVRKLREEDLLAANHARDIESRFTWRAIDTVVNKLVKEGDAHAIRAALKFIVDLSELQNSEPDPMSLEDTVKHMATQIDRGIGEAILREVKNLISAGLNDTTNFEQLLRLLENADSAAVNYDGDQVYQMMQQYKVPLEIVDLYRTKRFEAHDRSIRRMFSSR